MYCVSWVLYDFTLRGACVLCGGVQNWQSHNLFPWARSRSFRFGQCGKLHYHGRMQACGLYPFPFSRVKESGRRPSILGSMLGLDVRLNYGRRETWSRLVPIGTEQERKKVLAWQVLYFGAWSKQVEVYRRPLPLWTSRDNVFQADVTPLSDCLAFPVWSSLTFTCQFDLSTSHTPRHLLGTICPWTSSCSRSLKDRANHSLWTC